jgi:hypothetical protein
MSILDNEPLAALAYQTFIEALGPYAPPGPLKPYSELPPIVKGAWLAAVTKVKNAA